MFKLNLISFCDAPKPWGMYFQDSASPQMEALAELHDNIMFYLVIILLGVAWILLSIFINYVNNKSLISNKYNQGTLIELVWIVTPVLILILIAFPYFKLLYLMDKVTDPSLTVLVKDHRSYGSYEYPDFLDSEDEELDFDSDESKIYLLSDNAEHPELGEGPLEPSDQDQPVASNGGEDDHEPSDEDDTENDSSDGENDSNSDHDESNVGSEDVPNEEPQSVEEDLYTSARDIDRQYEELARLINEHDGILAGGGHPSEELIRSIAQLHEETETSETVLGAALGHHTNSDIGNELSESRFDVHAPTILRASEISDDYNNRER